MKIVFFISALIIYLTANYYVALRLFQLLPENTLVRISLFVILTICVGSFFLFFLFYKSLPYDVSSILYRTGTAWTIAFIYFLLFFIIIDLLKLSNNVFQFIDKDLFHSLTNSNYKSLFVIIATVFVLLLIGNINYHNKRRVHLNIETTKLSPEQERIRVVAISDLHLGYTIGEKELEKWVQLINKEKPDVVVIGGDLVDNNVQILKNMELDRTLRKIESRLGVYACLGNHEHISGKRESIDFHKESNIYVLKDTAVKVTDNLTLIGRDDYSNPNRKPLNVIVNDVDDSDFKLLLDHQPTNLSDAVKENIDLQFSGHTHKGQVFPLSLIVESIFENPYGMINKGLTSIYVSSGLGIWGGKFRIGTQSEYVVFDIIHKQK